MNKNKLVVVIFLLLFFCKRLFATQELIKKGGVVYSPGFCQEGSCSGIMSYIGEKSTVLWDYSSIDWLTAPIYQDAKGKITKAVFYTQPSVIKLIECLRKAVVDKQQDAIYLIGFSCGGGTALNALKKLVDYDNNEDYFKEGNHKVITKKDAEKIIAAINRGKICLSASLLDMKRVNGISYISGALLSIFSGIFAYVRYHAIDTSILWDVGLFEQPVFYIMTAVAARIGFIGILLFASFKACANGLISYVLPVISMFNFDPNHSTPIEGLEILQGKITCPVLIQIDKNDWVLHLTDCDKKRLYAAFGNDKLKILTTDDGAHDELSEQFCKELKKFYGLW